MPSESQTDLRRARAIARVLDSAVGVPGTPIRIGLDAVLGLVPGAGDIAGAVLSGYIVLMGLRSGVPRVVIWRMLTNIGIDTLFGSVPVLGDLFDVAYKSNLKNVDLLERHAAQPTVVERHSRLFAAVVMSILILLVLAIATAGFLVARMIWRLLTA
jgi:hypothetical protein